MDVPVARTPRRRGHSYLTPKARLGPSRLGGQGLLAVAAIPRHELVAIWGNRVMTADEMWALDENLRDFPVQVWHDAFMGPMAANEIEPVDYMNHSCAPNCGVRGSVVVVARRSIAPGEELTFDYGTTDSDRWTLECACGATTCRGRMTGDDWRDPGFRRRNRGYLSLYLQDLIAAERRGVPPVGLPPGRTRTTGHGARRPSTALPGGTPDRPPGYPGRPR